MQTLCRRLQCKQSATHARPYFCKSSSVAIMGSCCHKDPINTNDTQQSKQSEESEESIDTWDKFYSEYVSSTAIGSTDSKNNEKSISILEKKADPNKFLPTYVCDLNDDHAMHIIAVIKGWIRTMIYEHHLELFGYTDIIQIIGKYIVDGLFWETWKSIERRNNAISGSNWKYNTPHLDITGINKQKCYRNPLYVYERYEASTKNYIYTNLRYYKGNYFWTLLLLGDNTA